MGRHSGGPAAPPEPSQPSARPDQQQSPDTSSAGSAHPPHHLIERLALAVGAGGATGAVMAWAGAEPLAALLGAGGCAVVVLIASWMANSLPANPHTRRDVPPSREP